MSQEEFAARLGLKRGNIASYENKSAPPLEVLIALSKWYSISTDALLRVNLSECLTFDGNDPAEKADKKGIVARLREVMRFTEKKEDAFAASLDITEELWVAILEGKSVPDLDLLIALANTYTWLSLEWLIKGEGEMVGSTTARLNKVAEPLASKYFTKGTVSIELFMEQVLERLDKLEEHSGLK